MSEFEAQDIAGEAVKPEREGLPPGYRMRADPHYVELLSTTGARADRPRAESRAAWHDDGPAAAVTPRPANDRRVFDQLAEDIAAIESAAAMLDRDPSPLARRVSLDLIRAQAARAAWLLRAQALVAGRAPELAPRQRGVGALLAQVRDRVAAECRLVGVSLQVTVETPGTVVIDDALLSLGVMGGVLALLGLTAGQEGAVLRIDAVVQEAEADAEDDDLQAVEIAQDLVALPSSARQRFFDADWTDRPGGWLAAMGAASARAAAERLGGTVTLVAGARRGCTIRFSFA